MLNSTISSVASPLNISSKPFLLPSCIVRPNGQGTTPPQATRIVSLNGQSISHKSIRLIWYELCFESVGVYTKISINGLCILHNQYRHEEQTVLQPPTIQITIYKSQITLLSQIRQFKSVTLFNIHNCCVVGGIIVQHKIIHPHGHNFLFLSRGLEINYREILNFPGFIILSPLLKCSFNVPPQLWENSILLLSSTTAHCRAASQWSSRIEKHKRALWSN